MASCAVRKPSEIETSLTNRIIGRPISRKLQLRTNNSIIGTYRKAYGVYPGPESACEIVATLENQHYARSASKMLRQMS
jgi:hypothetical protein